MIQYSGNRDDVESRGFTWIPRFRGVRRHKTRLASGPLAQNKDRSLAVTSTRQPGKVRKEAALTRSGSGSLVSLLPCFFERNRARRAATLQRRFLSRYSASRLREDKSSADRSMTDDGAPLMPPNDLRQQPSGGLRPRRPPTPEAGKRGGRPLSRAGAKNIAPSSFDDLIRPGCHGSVPFRSLTNRQDPQAWILPGVRGVGKNHHGADSTRA